MKRYLLFDSGCNLCTQLAQDIEKESQGWLVARSLRDPEMHALLKEARPDWRWQPTLLEVRDDNINVVTGVALTTKIVQELGVRRAWRVAKLVYQANGAPNRIKQERRQFLQRSGALLATLPLLGLPSLRRGLSPVGATDLEWQLYRDKDFGFTLEYPTGWQVETKEKQPTPLIDDEAILKRVVFSSTPALVYLDVWLAKGKSLKEWLVWYKETRLVEDMLTEANGTVAGVPAATFLKEQQRDLMITYFSDGQYVYRLLNWMTSDPAHMDVYWHMLDTFTLPDVGSIRIEIPLWARREAARSAGQSLGDSNCCGYYDGDNPFICCTEGNCTRWVWYRFFYVPFTGNAYEWWADSFNYAAWAQSSQPSTTVDSIGCWNIDVQRPFGHVAFAVPWSGSGQVTVSHMHCNTEGRHCMDTDPINVSDPTQGWLYLQY